MYGSGGEEILKWIYQPNIALSQTTTQSVNFELFVPLEAAGIQCRATRDWTVKMLIVEAWETVDKGHVFNCM